MILNNIKNTCNPGCVLIANCKSILISVSILFFSFFSFAQDYLNFHTYDKIPTFPFTNFYDLTQDEFGYLWLATSTGLYKFNGKKFELIKTPLAQGGTLEKIAFYNVFRDSENNIWCGTYSDGLYKVDVDKNIAHHYGSEKGELNVLPDNRIKEVFEDPKGNIWVGCHKEGFCLYQPETNDFKCYKPSEILDKRSEERFFDDVLCFHFQNNKLWIGTLNGLLEFNPETEGLKYIDYKKNLSNPDVIFNATNGVRGICQLNDIEFIFHAYLNGAVVFKYNLKENSTTAIRLSPKGDGKNVSAYSLFRKGQKIWYVANDKIAQIDTQDFKVEWVGNSSEFSRKRFLINNFFEDDSGNIWGIGKLNLYQLREPKFSTSSYGVLDGAVYIYEQSDDRLLCLDRAANRGVRVDLENRNIQKFDFQLTGLKKNNRAIRGLFLHSDNKTYGNSADQIYLYDEKGGKFNSIWKNEVLFSETTSEAFISGYLDRQGNYWLGTKNNGIIKVGLERSMTEHFKNDVENGIKPIVYNGYPTGFFHDKKDRVWYGTDVGFGYYDYSIEGFVNFPFLSYTTDDKDFQMKSIGSFAEDRLGRVWLADSHYGLGYLVEGEDGMRIKVLAETSGLWDVHIESLVTDLNGDIWVSHWKGLSRIFADDLKVENYGLESGFLHNGILSPLKNGSIAHDKLGHVQVFWPDKMSEMAVEPKLIFSDFKVYDKSLNTNGNWNETEVVNLAYEQDFFSIYFETVNFQNPLVEELQYKMKGLHDEWVEVADQNYVSFANMRGGKYTFMLRSRMKNRKWGEVKELKINVASPFWETWWFYLLCASIIGGFIFSFYQYRIKKIKEKEELKGQFQLQLAEVEMTALRAQMNPHFLFNCLNSIKLFIVENDVKSAADYLTKFSKLIRLILQNSKDKLVILADELEALELYIEMEKMRFDHQFNYEINVAPDVEAMNIEVPPLLIQPYVENAIWHGLTHIDRPNRLLISIEKEKEKIICTIEDNGIGREAAQKRKRGRESQKKSLGMKITQNRIDLTQQLYKVETNVEIIDLKNDDGSAAGTRVILSMKF